MAGYSGTYAVVGDNITITYDGGTVYTGTISGDTMSGTMISYAGLTGCWDAVRVDDVPGSTVYQQDNGGDTDETGNAK